MHIKKYICFSLYGKREHDMQTSDWAVCRWTWRSSWWKWHSSILHCWTWTWFGFPSAHYPRIFPSLYWWCDVNRFKLFLTTSFFSIVCSLLWIYSRSRGATWLWIPSNRIWSVVFNWEASWSSDPNGWRRAHRCDSVGKRLGWLVSGSASSRFV